MHMVSKIAKREFEELVNQSELIYWREVLAILCTYAKPEKFQELCALLGNLNCKHVVFDLISHRAQTVARCRQTETCPVVLYLCW